MKKYLYVIFLTSCLLTIQPVSAELVQRDLFNNGDGLLTYDTDTKVEWLDISLTDNFSYNEIISGVGGWTDLGFQHATAAQVCVLINSGGLPLDCNYLPKGRLSASYIDTLTSLTTLIGAYGDAGITSTTNNNGEKYLAVHMRILNEQIYPFIAYPQVWNSEQYPSLKDYNYGHYLYRPASAVTLEVIGGEQQECQTLGGSNVQLSADLLVSDVDALDTLTWSLNGDVVGDTKSVELFLPLGTHLAEVTLITILGEVRTDTATILVEDTVAPTIYAVFLNPKTGAEVSSIRSKQKAEISLNVSDDCDPSPSSSATYGIPGLNGDVVSASTSRKDASSTKLTITGGATNVELSVTAKDESGNVSTSMSTLTIVP
ncbi:MAG: hypothetical protein ACQ9ET_03275 [Nitrosomonadaceae bacterium]